MFFLVAGRPPPDGTNEATSATKNMFYYDDRGRICNSNDLPDNFDAMLFLTQTAFSAETRTLYFAGGFFEEWEPTGT